MTREEKEEVLCGIPICEGIVIGTPFLLSEDISPNRETILEDDDLVSEVKRYREALKKSQLDLEIEVQNLVEEGSVVAADILDSHLEMLKDPLLIEMVEKKILSLKKNTESVIQILIDEYRSHFEKTEDKVFIGRIKDMIDISKRLVGHLINRANPFSSSSIPQNAVVIARELVPSATASKHVSGLISERGGSTSHTAIIARSKNLPFVSNICVEQLNNDLKTIIIDGYEGKVIINPTQKTKRQYENLLKEKKKKKSSSISSHIETQDGIPFSISASISSLEEMDLWAKEKHSFPISLIRTELLFFSGKPSFPSLDEQKKIYRHMIEVANGQSVTFRLFDLADDKVFNPFQRGIKNHLALLTETEMFHEHIEALFYASQFGKMLLLIPFITDRDEFVNIRSKIFEIKKSLQNECDIPIGTMIELPSAAICVDQLASEADFLSIGTNDLTQYLLAQDRTSSDKRVLFHPSLLRILSRIVRAAKKEKKALSICGELGSVPQYLPLLVGLGIHDFSLPPAVMETIAKAISTTSYEKARSLAKQASLISSTKELQEFIEEQTL